VWVRRLTQSEAHSWIITALTTLTT
jgi:hypothetical protein